ALMHGAELLDGAADARALRGEALALGRRRAGGIGPEGAIDRIARIPQELVRRARPGSKILLVESGEALRRHMAQLGDADRRARQAAGEIERWIGQVLPQRMQRFLDAGIELGRHVTRQDHAGRCGDRRMAYPPPARRAGGLTRASYHAAKPSSMPASASCSAAPNTSPVWPPMRRSAC